VLIAVVFARHDDCLATDGCSTRAIQFAQLDPETPNLDLVVDASDELNFTVRNDNEPDRRTVEAGAGLL